MQMVNVLFLKIVGMGLTAGIVIVAVLFARLLIRKLPKSFAYALWLVVAFRLVVPVTAGSDISIFNIFADESIRMGINDHIGDGAAGTGIAADGLDHAGGSAADGLIGQADAASVQGSAENAEIIAGDLTRVGFVDKPGISDGGTINSLGSGSVAVRVQSSGLVSVLAMVWIAGILTLVSYTAAAHIRVRRRVRYSMRLSGNVYECDAIRSPFVMGVIEPRIYLPFRLNAAEQQCVLAHERYHIRRKDYLVKCFAYLLAVVYWFQPLVWAAYHLMCIDMEMSCDEKVVSGFTLELRKEYSRLLLAFAVNRRQFSASPLAFGEENTMKRIKNIINYRKPSRWKLAVGAVVLAFTMAACATDAATDEARAPISDSALAADNDAENMTGVSEKSMADAAVENDSAAITANDSGRYDSDGDHQEEQGYHAIEHREAQWAENTKFDVGFSSLDYADSERIVLHISNSLFVYDLQEQRIVRSLDLKALGCWAVETGGNGTEGDCTIKVYQNSGGRLRAVITPYSDSEGGGYIYDIESDELFAYDALLLEQYVLFDGFVSKYDLKDEKAFNTWRVATNVLPLGEHSYGALFWDRIDLITMYYKAGEQKYQLFHKEQATLPRLLKQDDSFYQSAARFAGDSVMQCMMDYEGLYNLHDYAGVCALSTGLAYSDEMQREFAKRTDILSVAEEISHSEDEKEYLFCFSCGDDYGIEEPKVYVKFRYVEGTGWRAEGLPTDQP